MPYVKRQLQWIARTVMVKDNNIEEAMQVRYLLPTVFHFPLQVPTYYFAFGTGT